MVGSAALVGRCAEVLAREKGSIGCPSRFDFGYLRDRALLDASASEKNSASTRTWKNWRGCDALPQ